MEWIIPVILAGNTLPVYSDHIRLSMYNCMYKYNWKFKNLETGIIYFPHIFENNFL